MTTRIRIEWLNQTRAAHVAQGIELYMAQTMATLAGSSDAAKRLHDEFIARNKPPHSAWQCLVDATMQMALEGRTTPSERAGMKLKINFEEVKP